MADEKKKKWNIGVEEESVPAQEEISTQPQPVKEEFKQNKPKQKRQVKILIIKETYAMVDFKGNGEEIKGDFSKYKSGDMVEIDS